ncbi:MAG: glycosyltransferase family 4 protein [Pseudonocardiales bacterium]
MSTLHVVVPGGIDDPARPSGGNTYDRRICTGLAALGWLVHEHAASGGWPRPDPASRAALKRLITAIPDGSVVLLDGLIASAAADVLAPESVRLRLVVLVHMPLADARPGLDVVEAERAVLGVAAAVVTTSTWTRDWLLGRYSLPGDRLHVVPPGVDAAGLAPGTPAGGALLCVAAVTPNKGHDLLLAALATLTDLPWHLTCVGTLSLDPEFAERLGSQAQADALSDRITFVGARTGADLDAAYAAADVLVLASRGETYGMVVTEALARGLPVVATAVGGLPEALGEVADGSRPGVLITPGDSAALAAALRRWLCDTDLRRRLRSAAVERRDRLPDWSQSAQWISNVLAEVMNRPIVARVCHSSD